MPPTDRFVISFAAEPPQEGLPYGRWADTLASHFLAACREIDTEGEDIGDPGPVVIDEVAAQWLTLSVVPLDPMLFAIGFFLFRLADTIKPWPANWLDRNLKGGLGIMLDDAVAGLYSTIALYLVHRWLI